MGRICSVAAVSAVTAALAWPTTAAAQSRGCVFQFALGVSPPANCVDRGGLLRATGVAVTPDGANVVVASTRSGAVAALGRDAAVGGLAWRSCTSDNGTNGVDGTGGQCADGHALKGAKAVAVSPDGRHAYVAATNSGALDTFAFDGAGLVQRWCIKESAVDSRCDEGFGLAGARSVAVSPDGRHVYVAAAASHAVSWLSRDAETGRVSSAGCISATGSDGTCADGRGLLRATGVAVSEDGRWVHVVANGSEAVTSFARDPADGRLTQVDCLMADPPRGGSCRRMRTLFGAYGLARRPGGEIVVAARVAQTLTLLRTDPVTGRLTRVACAAPDSSVCTRVASLGAVQAVAAAGETVAATSAGGIVSVLWRSPSGLQSAGCFSAERAAPCVAVPGLAGAAGVAVAPGGRDLYVAGVQANAVIGLDVGAAG